MSQSILYNKSLNSDTPIFEVKVFKRKLRVYCVLSLILFVCFIVLFVTLILLWFGVIKKQPVVKLDRIVKVKCGLIEGRINDGIVEFLGVPYAYPPTGRRRFFHALEILDEKGCSENYGEPSKQYSAMKYKSRCVQYDKSNKLIGNEDCLYLNVFTPSTSVNNKLPVILVISGIFFVYGGSDVPGLIVLPEVVKDTQAIHVTCNYRIGPMNSIINPENNETNHGLSDLLMVLTWIRKNIPAFGGDPSNVILYGVGSGSTFALALFNSNKAVNLFSKLWISNPVTQITTSLSDGLKSQKIHLTDEKKLDVFQMTLPLEKIFKNWTLTDIERILENRWFNFPNMTNNYQTSDNNVHFLLVDNDLITESNILKKISINRNIPIVIGSNANEVDIFPSPATVRFWKLDYLKDYMKLRMKPFSATANKIFIDTFSRFYTKDPMMAAEEAYTRAVTDIKITCPLNNLLKAMLSFSFSPPIYRYILEDQHHYFDYFDMKYFNKLAAHGWDNILYFHGYKTHSDYGKYGKAEIAMSSTLNKAMKEFAWSDELADMAVSKDGRVIMNLIKNGSIKRECYLRSDECSFWETELGKLDRYMWYV